MKKLLPYLLLFILAGGGISCSDDDPTVPEPEAVMPPAPVASDITSDSFAISWEAVEGAVSYTYTLLHKNPHGAITVIVPETNTDALSAAFTDLKASQPTLSASKRWATAKKRSTRSGANAR